MKRTTILLAALLALGFLGGCEKFTPQNYDMVMTGDSKEHVNMVLGKPQYPQSDLWMYVHRNPYYQAKIYFQDDKVAKKEWANQETFFDKAAPKPTPQGK